MGLFASRPEEPDEWAGLPSEPLAHTHATDLDTPVAAADALTLGLGSQLGSIQIPAAPVLPDPEEPGPAESDDA